MDEPTKMLEGEPRAVPRLSFLLRLWCSNPHEPSTWRASLEKLHTGDRFGFADMEHLFAYLMELTEESTRRTKEG